MNTRKRDTGMVERKAPPLWMGSGEYKYGLVLGKIDARGAAIMVELRGPDGSLLGYICASLIDRPSIRPEQVSDLHSSLCA